MIDNYIKTLDTFPDIHKFLAIISRSDYSKFGPGGNRVHFSHPATRGNVKDQLKRWRDYQRAYNSREAQFTSDMLSDFEDFLRIFVDAGHNWQDKLVIRLPIYNDRHIRNNDVSNWHFDGGQYRTLMTLHGTPTEFHPQKYSEAAMTAFCEERKKITGYRSNIFRDWKPEPEWLRETFSSELFQMHWTVKGGGANFWIHRAPPGEAGATRIVMVMD